MAPTIKAYLIHATQRLQPVAGGSARLESEILLAHALQKTRTHLIAWSDRPLDPQEQAAAEQAIQRRLHGEPVAYITGMREFWSLELQVTSDTLIPRPETELLVTRVLQLLESIKNPTIADLGTGSGAIALALASERPDSLILATDRSSGALEVAKSNTHRLGIANVRLAQGDWHQALPEDTRFDIIVSNPPYICDADPHLKQGDLPYEPLSALISGTDGLTDIRTIASHIQPYLKPGGALLLEHGFDQGSAVRQILVQAGFQKVQTILDWEQRERVSEGFALS